MAKRTSLSSHDVGAPMIDPADPIPVDLPDYIHERNQQAVAAGLTIEKQKRTDMTLATWYRGTEAQWRASPFCHRAAPFVTSHSSVMERGFSCFGLSSGWRCGALPIHVRRIADAEFRGKFEEDLPEWIDDVGAGITAYGIVGENGQSVVYIGQLDEMIARKIAPKAAGESSWPHGDCLQFNGVAIGHAWECYALGSGLAAFRDNVGARERYNREKAAAADGQSRTTAMTPSKWLAEYDCAVAGLMKLLANKFARAATPGGQIFSLANEAREAIQDAVNELRDVVRGARVIVKDPPTPPPQDRVRLQQARSDNAFRQFMAHSGVSESPDTGL